MASLLNQNYAISFSCAGSSCSSNSYCSDSQACCLRNDGCKKCVGNVEIHFFICFFINKNNS